MARLKFYAVAAIVGVLLMGTVQAAKAQAWANPPFMIVNGIKPTMDEFGYGQVYRWRRPASNVVRIRTDRGESFDLAWYVTEGRCRTKVYEDLSGRISWVAGTLCIHFYSTSW